MNKYLRTLVCVPCGLLKMGWTKLFHLTTFSGPIVSLVSPYTEITMDNSSELRIGKNFRMRDGSKLRVRPGAVCTIGSNTSFGCNNAVVCHQRIEIGDDVQFGPNVLVYDHDHDFRVEGGLKAQKFQTSPVIIGNNVWVGANTVILRGTVIGDNCVIGAGSVLKGTFSQGSVIIQKRITEITSAVGGGNQ